MRNLILLYLFLTAGTVYSQPAGFIPVLVNSPEVQKDGKVIFRFLAPNARRVMLSRDGAAPREMSKDSAGVWSYTETLSPDIYPYTFNVDGNNLPDPNNPALKPIYKMSLGQSMVHVPGTPGQLSWEMSDVPRGTISHQFYKSRIIGDNSEIYVYTPPGYDPDRKQPYPVLYLFHGLTDDASAWTAAGRHILSWIT